MPTIEISDEHNGVLSFDLSDILGVLEPFAREFEWYISEFVPSVFVGANDVPPRVEPWVIALWHQIEESKVPIRLSWARLIEFARNLMQTENATLFALKPGSILPDPPPDLNSDKFEIVVQGVDTSFWAITTRNPTIIDQLRVRFKDTKIVPRTAAYY